jgi:predicted nucleotidyltransferase
MKRAQVLQILRDNEVALRGEYFVRSLALFGSVARDGARSGSDVDLLVDFDRPVGYFHVFKTEDFLEKCLGTAKVDLVSRRTVIPELRDRIYREAIDVFGADMVASPQAHR